MQEDIGGRIVSIHVTFTSIMIKSRTFSIHYPFRLQCIAFVRYKMCIRTRVSRVKYDAELCSHVFGRCRHFCRPLWCKCDFRCSYNSKSCLPSFFFFSFRLHVPMGRGKENILCFSFYRWVFKRLVSQDFTHVTCRRDSCLRTSSAYKVSRLR